MRRIDALEVIAAATSDLPVVVTCAATSRELAAVADRPNHLYLLDSMGLAGSVATGIALGLGDGPPGSPGPVVAIEGDGSLLMNPNVLPTGGFLRPGNIVMVLLDNGVYGSTANLPTYSPGVDLGDLADAAGWGVWRAETADGLRSALIESMKLDGPAFLHVRINLGNADVPNHLEDPVIIARRFQDWLAAGAPR